MESNSVSVYAAMSAIQQPEPLQEQGNLAVNWREWKSAFDFFLIASGREEASSKEKCAIFLHVIGKFGREIFQEFELSDKSDYAKLVQVFTERFDPKRNVNFERHMFFETYQDGSFDKYLTDLKIKSKSCEFGSLKNSLILTQIIRGHKDGNLRERLLSKSSLDLDEAVSYCRAAERASVQAAACRSSKPEQTSPALEELAHGRSVPTDSGYGFGTRTRGGGTRGRGTRGGFARAASSGRGVRRGTECDKCGGGHATNDRCPAYNIRCFRYEREGHFAKTCREKLIREIATEVIDGDCMDNDVVLGNLLLGYSMGWSAPVASKLKDPGQSPISDPVLDKELSLVVSCLIVGSIVGANIAGFIANSIGRKYCMMIFSSAHLAGYLLIANAWSYTVIVIGRSLAGLGGGVAVLNIVYIGEIGSPDIRGSLLAMSGIFHVFGTLLVYSVGPYVSFAVVCYVCVALNCAHLLALCYIPETPIFYLIKGKEHKAKEMLRTLKRSANINEELRSANENVHTILPQTSDQSKISSPSSWKQLISEKKNRKAFLISTTLFCLQDGGGVLAILFFATTIFTNSQSSVDPNVGTIILGLTELSGILTTSVLIERCGRKILLLLSTGACSLSMGLLGTYFYLEVTHASMVASLRWLPLVLLVICLFSFNIGLGIVPNTLTGEMYSPRLRSYGSSVSITIAWSLSVITSASFGYIVAELHNHGVFWMYSVINAFGFLFTMFVVPETRGKTLTEIGDMLEK